jgi:hypothetical protein
MSILISIYIYIDILARSDSLFRGYCEELGFHIPSCCEVPFAFFPMPTAYCLLPMACGPLPIAYCLLPIAYCLLPIAHCPLPNAAYCMLSIDDFLPLFDNDAYIII